MQVVLIVGLTFLGASAALYFWAESLKKEKAATVGNQMVSAEFTVAGQSQLPSHNRLKESVGNPPPPDDTALYPPYQPSSPGQAPIYNPPVITIPPPQTLLPDREGTIHILPDESSEALSRIEIEIGQLKTYQIKREVRITYSRMSYTGRACYLTIKVGKEHGVLPPMTAEERLNFKQKPEDWMQFEAYEPYPLMQAELKYAEGEFSSARTKLRQRLKRDEETLFQFVMKPLKDEDCILTVVISYVHSPSQAVQPTIAGTGKQDEVEGEGEEVEKMEEILATDLVITVNSMFGLGASQANLAKNVIGILGAGVLLFIAVQNGQLMMSNGQVDGLKVTGYVILTVANAAGIPIFDAVKNLYTQRSA